MTIQSDIAKKVAGGVLKAKANSPRIFFVAGVVGVVGGTVLACRATLKLRETTDTINQEVAIVKTVHEVDDTDDSEYNRSLALAYGRGALSLAKLYGPSLILTGASLGLLTGSHVTLTRRNAATGAAYAALSESYDQYRDRVKTELDDPEKEMLIYHAAEWQEVEGSEGKLQELVADPGAWSPYSRFFDHTNSNWQADPTMNRIFIEGQESYANHLLVARGYVFLNEIYGNLGIPHSSAGQLVGWVVGGDGDDYIDFGTFEARDAKVSATTGQPPSLVLDFNVDGVVYDLI